MISLEQVRQLDIRVKKAVTAVKNLSSENAALKQRIAELEDTLGALRQEESNRRQDEQQLEVSLQGVLDVLDEVDGETADIEPEPPAGNYVIETVDDDDFDEEIEEDAETGETVPSVDEGTVSEVPEPEAGQTDEPESAAVDMPAVEESDGTAAPAAAEATGIIVEIPAAEAPELKAAVEKPEEAAGERKDSPSGEPVKTGGNEEVDLDSGSSEEADMADDDQFQSEFDIF